MIMSTPLLRRSITHSDPPAASSSTVYGESLWPFPPIDSPPPGRGYVSSSASPSPRESSKSSYQVAADDGHHVEVEGQAHEQRVVRQVRGDQLVRPEEPQARQEAL
jgi:hypothetical protein